MGDWCINDYAQPVAYCKSKSEIILRGYFGAVFGVLTGLSQTVRYGSMTKPYTTYGKEHIEQGALTQMDNVMSLTPVVKGALMPDAHQGYGMPIGGVCAVDNAVIPYAVGVDIGCRMHLSVLPLSGDTSFKSETCYAEMRKAILANTYFGGTALPPTKYESPIFDDPRWNKIEKLGIGSTLKDRARSQLGTSGGGNHFVEWGTYDLPVAGYPNQLALLSHSGSRSLGFTIANFFTKLAARINPLPEPLNELSWLSMDTEEGQDYWDLMNLCGEYSAINHQAIHENVIKALGDFPTKVVSNHHNFAWVEEVDGKKMYVHRKGATPAGAGVTGIIPSSMATKAYIVTGNGNADSINSASHGSGRAMSRSKAIKTIKQEDINQLLKQNQIDCLGGGVDESPMAYKDIEKVMDAQKDLVTVVASFQPRIVRMAGRMEIDLSEGA
jgi:tRNA-splicing ligase RtcB